MSAYLPGLLIAVALAIVALGLMVLGWRRRMRRDATIVIPEGSSIHPEIGRWHGIHVATTRAGEQLNRVAAAPLGFRSAVQVRVSDADVQLDLAGGRRVLITRSALDDSGRATWTIDRAVEKGGLVVLTWRSEDDTALDTYLRVQDGGSEELLDALAPLHSRTTPLSGDAR